MQVKCQSENCFGYLEKTETKVELFSELGFSKKFNQFICKECGKKFVICGECEGEGFSQTIHGNFDCEVCNGSGLVEI